MQYKKEIINERAVIDLQINVCPYACTVLEYQVHVHIYNAVHVHNAYLSTAD